MSGPMTSWMPAPRTALDYFSLLVAQDAGLPILEAAAAIGQDLSPGLDLQALLTEIDGVAERLRRRIPADAMPLQRWRLLNQLFYKELGFAGNVNHYHDPANSDLGHVWQSRRGIPITLALLYLEMAAHAGLRAQGVGFPGHFLVMLRIDSGVMRGDVFVDPFSGQSLSRDRLMELLEAHGITAGRDGNVESLLKRHLRPASAREILARMLRNLKTIHQGAGDWSRLRAVMDRLVVLLPEAWSERRDRGLVLAALGLHDAAAADFAAYLAHCPSAADAPLIRNRLQAWNLAVRCPSDRRP